MQPGIFQEHFGWFSWAVYWAQGWTDASLSISVDALLPWDRTVFTGITLRLSSLYSSLLLVCHLQVGGGIWFPRRSEAPACSVCRNVSGYSAEDCYRWTSSLLDRCSCSLYVSMIEVVFPSDQTFTSFYPEARLPLSLIQGKPVYVEVSLLDPPEPGLVLLVHSCSAFSQTAYPSWMVIYDGCVHNLRKTPKGSELLPA